MERFFAVLACGALMAALGQPAPACADAPSPAPNTSPHPAAPPTYVRFIEAGLLTGERVATAFTPHLTGPVTNRLRAAAEYRFFGRNFVEIDVRRWDERHPSGFVTQPVALSSRFVPAALFRGREVFVNNSIIGSGHTYLATSTLVRSCDTGEPNLHAAFGIGIERLPDPTKRASLYFSTYYYPELTGKIAGSAGVPSANLRYKSESYAFGGDLAVPSSALFFTAGILAGHDVSKQNAASNATRFSTQLGLGFRV